MTLIKLDATESTNLYLKDLTLKKNISDFTVVSCGHQTKGRGQMGTSWVTESGKNLTFSILKLFGELLATEQFKINMAVSLALLDVLKDRKIPEISIKWPNDIMAGNQKICGILIENMLKGKHIQSSIIGIGLNVNQINFGNLSKATSMHLITRKLYDLDTLLVDLLKLLKKRLLSLDKENLYKEYEQSMFKLHVPSTFIERENSQFIGFVEGVEQSGMLKIRTENGKLRQFGLKEIRMVY